MAKLKFKCIWTIHLSKNNKGCALVGQKHQMTTTKTTTQLQMFVFHIHQPPYLCSCELVYDIVAVGFVQNLCINPNILKS